MKVKIGNYISRWNSDLHSDYMDKKYGGKGLENSEIIDHYVEGVDDMIQWFYDHTINLYLDRKKRTQNIRIDKFDTWGMDDTLSNIVLPMLIQLRDTQHGAPFVHMRDVPKELRATKEQLKEYKKSGESITDETHFKRWEWVMDEMIWTFEQKCRDEWTNDYIECEDDPEGFLGTKFTKWDDKGMKSHQKRMTNGFRLFGTYFENLWD